MKTNIKITDSEFNDFKKIFGDTIPVNYLLKTSRGHTKSITLYLNKSLYDSANNYNINSNDDTRSKIIEKINEVYQNSTTSDISKCKKAFITPGGLVSLDQIKNVLSQNSIKITNNYNNADLIVTNNNYGYTNYRNLNIYSTERESIFLINNRVYTYQIKDDYLKNNKDSSAIKKIEKFEGVDINKSICCNDLSDRIINSEPNFLNDYSYETANFYRPKIFTGLAVKMLLDYSNKNKKFINGNDLIDLSSSITPLTEELLTTIENMLSNSSDVDLALNLIINIDTNKNQHLIYDLFNNNNNYSRIRWTIWSKKDFKVWYNKLKYRYSSIQPGKLIEKLHANNELTRETFIALEKKQRPYIKVKNNSMYKITMTLNDEYKEILSKLK